MESFFALLQGYVLDRRYWHTGYELSLANVTWIERTYDRRRRQRALGRLTPLSSNCSSISSQPRPDAPDRTSQLDSGQSQALSDRAEKTEANGYHPQPDKTAQSAHPFS